MNRSQATRQAPRRHRSGASGPVRLVLTRSRALVRERLGPFRLLVVVKSLQWPIRSLTGSIARRIRRDQGLVAFGCEGGRFAGNPAYLFLHMSRHSAVRCVWISSSRATVEHVRSQGLAAERRWSLAGIRAASVLPGTS